MPQYKCAIVFLYHSFSVRDLEKRAEDDLLHGAWGSKVTVICLHGESKIMLAASLCPHNEIRLFYHLPQERCHARALILFCLISPSLRLLAELQDVRD